MFRADEKCYCCGRVVHDFRGQQAAYVAFPITQGAVKWTVEICGACNPCYDFKASPYFKNNEIFLAAERRIRWWNQAIDLLAAVE